MLSSIQTNKLQIHWNLKIVFRKTIWFHCLSETDVTVERIARVVNDHPLHDKKLHSKLRNEIPPGVLSTTFVENVLGHLFGAHSNGIKAYEFFRFCLLQPHYVPSSDAFEKTLHILTRMRYFDKAWELMETFRDKHPFLLTLKSISIMISRIAKFQSYEETLEAFDRIEKDIFSGKQSGSEEFNILLRAFSTQRQMKEARSVFNKFQDRFSPDTKTMNILLLGFKESGDTISVELFYHEMNKRGFKPNTVTYSIRIDAYCKKGYLGDALRLLEEMEQSKIAPTLEIFTTLVHGAGIARNVTKAKELFDEIPRRNLEADTGMYNALISSLIRCKDVKAAAALMYEMEEKHIRLDNVTYHTMFLGLMRSYGVAAVSELYQKMIERNFVPKTQTIVMLMKFFCVNQRLDLGVNLWSYLLEKGHCPHSHALDLLVTGLCSRGMFVEAFDCSMQMLLRGRIMSELSFRMLERYLLQIGEMDKLQKLDKLISGLQKTLPSSSGHAKINC